MTHERKTIAVDKEIAEKLADISKSEGMTLYSLINEIMETAIYAYKQKVKFSDIIDEYLDFMVAKDIGMIFAPLKIENMVNKLAFQTEVWDTLLNELYNYGKLVSNYTKVRYPGNELAMISRVNKTLYLTNTEISIS